ncbi:MAG TPA: alpha-glucosidase/alpha-galactosidase, partial [Actinomycetota bacterium]
MAIKVALIGAGSARCYRELMDLCAFDGVGSYEVALHDPAPRRLAVAGQLARRVAAATSAPCTITTHAERPPALDGADVVLTSISVGMQESIRPDFEIPARYGLRQTVADTIGIGGIMRILRTAPAMAAIAADMRRYCPGGLLLNESNPLAMVGMALDRLEPQITAVHLCHSPGRTAATLAGWLGVPPIELECEVAGVNHQAWVLRLAHHGEDLYPRLRELARKEEGPDGFASTVRADMLRRLGWFPTESSKHNAEYVPWYLPWDWEVERYGLQVNPYWERRAHNVEGFASVADLAD